MDIDNLIKSLPKLPTDVNEAAHWLAENVFDAHKLADWMRANALLFELINGKATREAIDYSFSKLGKSAVAGPGLVSALGSSLIIEAFCFGLTVGAMAGEKAAIGQTFSSLVSDIGFEEDEKKPEWNVEWED